MILKYTIALYHLFNETKTISLVKNVQVYYLFIILSLKMIMIPLVLIQKSGSTLYQLPTQPKLITLNSAQKSINHAINLLITPLKTKTNCP